MNLTETTQEDTLTLAAEGRLDSNTSESFERRIMGHIDQGVRQLVIDFSALDYISSAGLRVLLMTAKRLKVEGGSVALCGLKENIREVFEISGFLPILTVVDSRADALAAVRA